MRTIQITVPGRLRSKKNNYVIGKGKLHLNAQLMSDVETIQWAARQALMNRYAFPLEPKTPFSMDIDVYIADMKGADLDGIASTVLDALEGDTFLYPNDRYAMSVNVNRYLDVEFERVVITVEELPRDVLKKRQGKTA